ncbi:CHASE2 domain-containing protein [Cyanobacteria bacterium FACHB-502]|nr:CHASE2 domain-containing protein [Leptolyngbya sp. FACHB-711]MBD1848881.1 CHASE2 domain-containing protein [Cyanobacteria bacterium FACHB-502]MBD2023032.1 CHASE2 domain-containing protein [Leptolyngbya sp. FACHB-711]
MRQFRKQFNWLRVLLKREHRPLWKVSLVISASILLLRYFGLLQAPELAMLDQMFRLRPIEAADPRIVLVTISDADIRQIQAWPIPDQVLANLIERVRTAEPRAIGLTLYRDLSVGEGQAELERIFATTPNLIGTEKLPDNESAAVAPPTTLERQQQVGFNNVVIDADNVVRRSLLFLQLKQELHRSFALKLALKYLEPESIGLRARGTQVEIGSLKLLPIASQVGGYMRADVGGYQILANPRSPAAAFESLSLSQVLSGEFDPEIMRDRVVLIGSTSDSVRDVFYTSYSGGLGGNSLPISGVELQAQFVSQLLSAVLDQRPLLHVPPEGFKILWLWLWCWVGAALCWWVRPLERSAVRVGVASLGLMLICYVAFLLGYWLPLVPPLSALLGATIAMTGRIARQEGELKKSKEFLNSIINTIPDPVFVKNQSHRWIVLNRAFAHFIGYPIDVLLEKTDFDFFPAQEANRFWEQDQLTFQRGTQQETEEEFTDAKGVTYLIATKRSLHRDAAGNVFLVGVIRDITRRKQVEEELRRTAAELVQSNAELQQAKEDLTRLAFYDLLTGLANRKLLQERLSSALTWANPNQMVAVLFLDLDGFKQINDTYGHHIGDLLLRTVAQRLLGCLRSSDTVARLGGDEFVVVLPGIPSISDVICVADKILLTLSQKIVLQGELLSISTSVGISLYPIDSITPSDLLKQADAAMYRAKQRGKNCYEFHQTGLMPADCEEPSLVPSSEPAAASETIR